MLFFFFQSMFCTSQWLGFPKAVTVGLTLFPKSVLKLIEDKSVALKFPLTNKEQSYVKREHFWKPRSSLTVQKSLSYNHLSKDVSYLKSIQQFTQVS